TYKMRVGRGPGRPDLVSARPCKKDKHGNRIYTDSDEKPTLITFDEHCRISDLPFWLRIGHLKEYTPPVVKVAPPVVPPVAKTRKEAKPRGGIK
ncbi:unnamed protein product, partial [marine sediment metagenome]